MKHEDIMLSDQQHRKTNTVWVHLYKASRIGEFVEMESRMVTVRGSGGRREGLLFNGYRVSIFQDGRSWRWMWWWLPSNLKWFRWGTSLGGWWWAVCLPMHRTYTWSLFWDDLTCLGATKPMRHNYQSPQVTVRAPQQEKPPQWQARTVQHGVATVCHN